MADGQCLAHHPFGGMLGLGAMVRSNQRLPCVSSFWFYLLLLPALVIFPTCPPVFAASRDTSGEHTGIKSFFLPLLRSLQPLCLLGGT